MLGRHCQRDGTGIVSRLRASRMACPSRSAPRSYEAELRRKRQLKSAHSTPTLRLPALAPQARRIASAFLNPSVTHSENAGHVRTKRVSRHTGHSHAHGSARCLHVSLQCALMSVTSITSTISTTCCTSTSHTAGSPRTARTSGATKDHVTHRPCIALHCTALHCTALHCCASAHRFAQHTQHGLAHHAHTSSCVHTTHTRCPTCSRCSPVPRASTSRSAAGTHRR